jgi:hypothetical protein
MAVQAAAMKRRRRRRRRRRAVKWLAVARRGL